MTRLGQLRLGPLQFNVYGSGDEGVVYRDPAYLGFWFPGISSVPQSGDAAVSMEVELVAHPKPLPRANPDYEAGRNWACWNGHGVLTVCTGFQGQPVPRVHMELDLNRRHAQIHFDPVRTEQGGVMPLSYPVDQILSWGLLGPIGGVILHGALMERDGVAWVVAGRSGAGKSTLSGLCHAEGWHILNDDRSILFLKDGILHASGNPWHGSGRFAEPGIYPLGGIFFIEKSASEALHPLANLEARYRLLDVAAVPWFHDTWAASSLAAVEGIASAGMCRRFAFSRSAAAVSALDSAIRLMVAA